MSEAEISSTEGLASKDCALANKLAMGALILMSAPLIAWGVAVVTVFSRIVDTMGHVPITAHAQIGYTIKTVGIVCGMLGVVFAYQALKRFARCPSWFLWMGMFFSISMFFGYWPIGPVVAIIAVIIFGTKRAVVPAN